jgi:hypothetical protein
MRHILVRDYFQVDLEVVWQVVEKDLKGLKKVLRDIKPPSLQEASAPYRTGPLGRKQRPTRARKAPGRKRRLL